MTVKCSQHIEGSVFYLAFSVAADKSAAGLIVISLKVIHITALGIFMIMSPTWCSAISLR